MNNIVLVFLLLNFFIAAISDIILNILSNNVDIKIIKSLNPYFKQKTFYTAAFLAGITIIIGVLLTIIITKSIFNITIPTNVKELLIFSLTAFGVGVILDILIYKLSIFGNSLDEYYNVAGAGLLGGLALVFTIVLSYSIQQFKLI
jgi:hypothetical protein